MQEPLSVPAAESLIQRIREEGQVVLSGHARDRMRQHDLTAIDVDNVLRGGFADDPDYENGTWRYPIRTQRITVIIAFRSEFELVVVTTWREGIR